MIMAAAAFSENSFCGLLTQLNICIGNTVNESMTLSGTKGTKVSAPITISGAVSPIALERERITPVNIPETAAGNT